MNSKSCNTKPVPSCELELLALSFLDSHPQPSRDLFLKWCTDNNVEPENDLWTCVLLQHSLIEK